MGKLLRIAFARSVLDGLGVWLGVALMTTPAVLLLTWIGIVILG
jgi:hypothetical protein